MLENNERLQHFGQNSVVHKAPCLLTAGKHIRKVSRHRSFDANKSSTDAHAENTIHVSIRKPERNRMNNNKSVNAIENLLVFSSILSTRYWQRQSNQSSFNQSLSKRSKDMTHSLKETDISSHRTAVLERSENTWNNNHWNSNPKKKKVDLTNPEEQMNHSQQQDDSFHPKRKTISVKSPKVTPNPNNLSEHIIQISNENNSTTKNQRSNKLDFIKDHSDFSKKEQIKKNKRRQNCCCPPTCPCIFGSILGTLLLGAIIGATVGGILSQQKSITTVITTTATTTTSVTTTATTSTTTTTTTTTNMPCGTTCVNTTVSTLSRIAFYSFDNVTTDAMSNYPTSGISSPTYVSGWIGSAISFNYSNSQFLSTSHIPLNSRSFSIDFWFYVTDLNADWDFSFGGESDSPSSHKCLFLNIRNKVLFFGFFNDDIAGNSILSINRWYHVAFVYDNTTQQQYIYLNGILDANASAAPLQTTTGLFTIGGANIGGSTSAIVYYSGYIDHFTISSRALSACEVYLAATLACYFTFDSVSSINDSGPNFLTATNIGATLVTGRFNQALQFSSALSYITINGIQALTSSNTAFTISMWVNPTTITGGATLIHASTQSNGQGTCLAMWGLTSSGLVTVNVIDSSNNTISATASSALPLNTWTHITQTFSSTTGNYLYINGTFVTSVSTSTGRPIGPYAILGASPGNTSYCEAGSITMGQFYGSIDEYHVFGRELTTTDICRLANP